MRQVVITGMGAVTPLGNDVDAAWDAVIAGRSGVAGISGFDPSDLITRIAAEVKDFDPQRYLSKREARRVDRTVQMAVDAAGQAIDDAAIDLESVDPFRVGVVIGSGIGGISTLLDQHGVFQERGPGRVSPFFIPAILSDMPGGYTAIRFGAKGPNFAVVAACATGNMAMGTAAEIIASGAADVVLAGGAEAAITPLTVAGFDAMKALCSTFNDDPERASRPFDRDRSGFVIGEGAGVLVMEERHHAVSRGAHIRASFLGYGATDDAFHVAAPDPEAAGAAQAMITALNGAAISPEDVDYINAHGTSTPLNDATETRAIKAVLEDNAYRIPVSSTKGATGHLLGAAGAVEAILTVRALETGVVPPTLNYEHPDPSCDLDYVPNEPRRSPIRIAASNAFGFGGHNACLMLGRADLEEDR
jgi:3-oxoacyl-[acyl-carrier-protein] synthase II